MWKRTKGNRNGKSFDHTEVLLFAFHGDVIRDVKVFWNDVETIEAWK